MEFIDRERIKQVMDHPLDGHSLLCVSEIGMPVFNTEDMKQQLVDLGLPIVRDFNSFKAFGDDDGLFIVVDKDREWFMGNKKPMISKISVKINGNKTMEIKIPKHPYIMSIFIVRN